MSIHNEKDYDNIMVYQFRLVEGTNIVGIIDDKKPEYIIVEEPMELMESFDERGLTYKFYEYMPLSKSRFITINTVGILANCIVDDRVKENYIRAINLTEEDSIEQLESEIDELADEIERTLKSDPTKIVH